MSLDAIVGKIRESVAESGFDKSVKFDLGSDGVIVVDGQTVSTQVLIARSPFPKATSKI